VSRTDDVLAAIEAALADADVSPDAVRSRPPPSDVERMRAAAADLRRVLGLAWRRRKARARRL